jgi:hypothetical protein
VPRSNGSSRSAAFSSHCAHTRGARVDVDSQALLRVGWRPSSTWRAAASHLRRIEGFDFWIEDGTFFYSTRSGVTGRASCNSSAFKKFLRAVIRQQPRSIDTVLELM